MISLGLKLGLAECVDAIVEKSIESRRKRATAQQLKLAWYGHKRMCVGDAVKDRVKETRREQTARTKAAEQTRSTCPLLGEIGTGYISDAFVPARHEHKKRSSHQDSRTKRPKPAASNGNWLPPGAKARRQRPTWQFGTR